MKNPILKKLAVLFILQFLFHIFHYYFFLLKIPTYVETRKLLVHNPWHLLLSFLLVSLILYLLYKGEKFGYYLAWIVTIASIISVLAYGFYYSVVEIISIAFGVYAVAVLITNGMILKNLLKYKRHPL